MGLISKETALRIALAYQEIERGEGMLADVRETMAQREKRWPDKDTDLRDVFGQRQRLLQLGVPTGTCSHRLCGLSYELAVPIIEAHIANERAQLAALSALARRELDAAPVVAVEPKGVAS